MDVDASLDAECDAATLFAHVDSLDDYDQWLEIVPRTEPADTGDDGAPAWFVTLRGRLGPLARSKRLRMVRTECEAPGRAGTGRVVFERRELDGREHSPWVLTALVAPGPKGARLTMQLHYGGSMWVPLLDRLLAGEIEASRKRLQARITTSG